MRDFGHANFGVTHRRGAVAIDRTEVTLAIDQHVAHREILRHAHDGIVNSDVAMRMVFTNHVADNTGRFFVSPIPVVVELVHGIQNTSMHRLQTIAHIGQGATHNHTHRIVEVRAFHLFFEADGDGFFGK